MLLYDISSKNQIASDRFYRALYSKLPIPAVMHSSKVSLVIFLSKNWQTYLLASSCFIVIYFIFNNQFYQIILIKVTLNNYQMRVSHSQMSGFCIYNPLLSFAISNLFWWTWVKHIDVLMVTLHAIRNQDASTSVQHILSWHLMVLNFFVHRVRIVGAHLELSYWHLILNVCFNIPAGANRTVNLMHQGIENLRLCVSSVMPFHCFDSHSSSWTS